MPDLVQRKDRPIEVEQLSGTLNPGDRMVGGRYLMKLSGHPPEGTSPWGGMSGAAMFCEGLLTGVIIAEPAQRAHAALEAVPVALLLRDPGFAAVVNAHTGSPGTWCEAIELRALADAQERSLAGKVAPSPAALLPARRAVVPFHGRVDLLGALDTWARQPDVGAWLLHGAGGQGKTRLAHHFASHLAREGWAVLWLDPRAEAPQLPVLADIRVPALVVLDYAENRTTQLAAIADVLARRGSAVPLKLLLLARTAGAWWTDTLPAAGETARDLADASRVVSLPALDDTVGGRQHAYRAAVAAYAAALSRVPGHDQHSWMASAAALTSQPAPKVGGQTVLAVQMTALADLLDTADLPTVALPGDRVERGPEDRLLDHERGYWQTTAATYRLGVASATLADVVAATALLAPATTGELDSVLARVPAVADLPRDRQDAVRGWLLHLYPSGEVHGFSGLEPDRLAERLVGRLLLDDTRPCIVETLAAHSDEPQAQRILTVATRAAAHAALGSRLGDTVTALCLLHTSLLVPTSHVATRVEQPRPLLRALEQAAVDPSVDMTVLRKLSNALPEQSHVLADVAVTIDHALVLRHRQVLGEDPQGDGKDLAQSLNNLSIRLGEVGRREDALAAITEAVEIYRQLSEQRPDAFLPDRANSLNNLSTRLGGVGRREDALAAITEAVEIQRRLAEQDPDAFLPNLAMSLNNLSNRLADVGRREDALAVIREAVEIRRGLAEQRPDAFLPDVAMSLNNLSIRLGDVGRRQDALAVIREAVEIRRGLAEQRPDAFLPDVAMSLNNLAIQLGDVGRHEDAMVAITEAVEVYRRLAEQRPDVFLPNVASGLNNLSIELGDVGRHEDAMVAITEAIEIYRRLTEQRPDTHGENLNQALRVLASMQEKPDASSLP